MWRHRYGYGADDAQGRRGQCVAGWGWGGALKQEEGEGSEAGTVGQGAGSAGTGGEAAALAHTTARVSRPAGVVPSASRVAREGQHQQASQSYNTVCCWQTNKCSHAMHLGPSASQGKLASCAARFICVMSCIGCRQLANHVCFCVKATTNGAAAGTPHKDCRNCASSFTCHFLVPSCPIYRWLHVSRPTSRRSPLTGRCNLYAIYINVCCKRPCPMHVIA